MHSLIRLTGITWSYIEENLQTANYLITQPCKFGLFCANKMAPGVYEGILHAEHEMRDPI